MPCSSNSETTRSRKSDLSATTIFQKVAAFIPRVYRIGANLVLDVQVADAGGVGLDEGLARRHVVAHEVGEDGVCLHRVRDRHLQEDAPRRVHRRVPELVRVHLAEALVARGHLPLLAGDHLVAVALRVDVTLLAADLHLEQRRLGDVEVALVDQRPHVAEEEGQQQGADVGAVDVGVGHDDDAVIAQLGEVELLVDAGAQGLDHRHDLDVAEDLVEARLLDVENLALDREDRLEAAVAAALGRAAGRDALDDEHLAVLRVAVRAVGQLAGEHRAVEESLADDEVARFARRLARPRRGDALLDDAAAVGRVLLQVLGEAFADRGLDLALDLRVAEARLRLTLELGLRQLHTDGGDEAFAHVVAAEVGVLVLEELLLAGVVVEHAREGGAEAGQVAAAVDRVDAVDEAEGRLVEGVVVLDGALDARAVHLPLDVDRAREEHASVAVEVADEALDAALEVERDLPD